MSDSDEAVILGTPRCPSCGARFTRLRAGKDVARRDCVCGKRWALRFEPASQGIAERLGVKALRVVAEPYVDRRRRRADEAQMSFAFDAPLAERSTRRRRAQS